MIILFALSHLQLFEGNKDGDHVMVNDFETPIIAQFIRINPTRWRDRISLRIQLYGCDYGESLLMFSNPKCTKKLYFISN